MRKNRKKKSTARIILIASSIIMLNLLGISYANWNDNTDMQFSISTGSIKPYFIGDEIKIVGNSKGEIYVEDSTNKKTDKGKGNGKENNDEDISGEIILTPKDNTLLISGWCYPGFNQNIFINVGNEGTIPVVFKGIEPIKNDDIIKQIDFKEKDNNGELKIHLQADNEKKAEVGDYSFEYQLQFEQAPRE